MKKILIITLLILLLLLLMGIVYSAEKTSVPGDLRAYVQPITGTWVLDSQADAIPYEGASYEDLARLAFFSLHIDASLIEGNTIRIPVSLYCQKGMYLHFKLNNNRLEYTGASIEGTVFDLARIEFMYISRAGDGQTLIFESMETEKQNYRRERLVRTTGQPVQTAYWQCGLQYYFISLLVNGEYDIWNAKGDLLDREKLLSTEEAREDLKYFSENSYLMPGMEELCVRTEFDIVVLYSNAPADAEDIFAIEWEGKTIRLYETEIGDLSKEHVFPLKRGELLYTIQPRRVLQEHSL